MRPSVSMHGVWVRLWYAPLWWLCWPVAGIYAFRQDGTLTVQGFHCLGAHAPFFHHFSFKWTGQTGVSVPFVLEPCLFAHFSLTCLHFGCVQVSSAFATPSRSDSFSLISEVQAVPWLSGPSGVEADAVWWWRENHARWNCVSLLIMILTSTGRHFPTPFGVHEGSASLDLSLT